MKGKNGKRGTVMKVVFVCLGNICRSPMAEAVFRKMVHEEGLEDKITIDSAATSTWEHGNPVHHGTRKKLEEHGISAKSPVYHGSAISRGTPATSNKRATVASDFPSTNEWILRTFDASIPRM